MEATLNRSNTQVNLEKNGFSMSDLENALRKIIEECSAKDNRDIDLITKLEKIIKENVSAIDAKQDYSQFQSIVDDLKTYIETCKKNLSEEYEDVSNARLEVIEQQNKTINMLRQLGLIPLIKSFFSPKIGILYHYKPKMLKIPSHYEKRASLKKPPTLSIVTPSFNHGRFIERTLTSIMSQQYPALEYIVQDGKSTDNTAEIMSQYVHLLKHWESIQDNGQSHALNLGLRHATGEIMSYLNSDDILLPGTLHYIARYFENHPKVDVVYGHRVLIDEYDQEVGRWILPPHCNQVLSWVDYIPQETLFWRRRIWEKVGGCFDESFRFAMDWDLLLRFKEAGAKFSRLPRFLGAFRIHPHQKTSAQIASLGEEEMSRIRLRCHNRPVSPAEIGHNIRKYKIKHIILHRLYHLGILRY